MEGGAPAAGWTMYPPLVLQGAGNVPFMIFAVHLLGMSSIMGAINIIVTIVNMRAPGMTLLKMPLFVWTWFITAFLLVAAMPVFAGATSEESDVAALERMVATRVLRLFERRGV